MIQDNDPVWKQDLYTSYGKWMDGWESRRRRTEGHDWCIVQLGQSIHHIFFPYMLYACMCM
jgi:allantoicase